MCIQGTLPYDHKMIACSDESQNEVAESRTKKVLTFYFQTNKLRVDDKLTKKMNEMKMED